MSATWERTDFRPLGHPCRPRLIRYRPADRRARVSWNRYPGSVIGAAIVVGGWCYGLKWATPAGYRRASTQAAS